MRKTVTIGDLGTIITGNTPPRDHPELYGNHTPFVKATDISETEKFTYNPEECYSKEGYDKYIRSLVPKGSTCVVTIGSIGKKMTMAHCDMFINQAMNAIIPNENFDKEFVYYAVKNVLPNIKGLDSGTASGRENVSKSAFSKMEVLVDDDIEIQRRIATILSRYDALIENYQKQIKLLEEAAQRLYKEWFVDLRFPGYENTKVVDGVPEGWEKKKLGEIILKSIGGGWGKDYPQEKFDKEGFVIRGTDISKLKYGNLDEIPFRFHTESNLKERTLCDGDIIFEVSGGSDKDPVGRMYFMTKPILDYYKKDVICASFCKKISFPNKLVSLLCFYAMQYCRNSGDMKKYEKDSAGNIINFAWTTFLENFHMLVPNENFLKNFYKIANANINQQVNISLQIRLLTEARDRLLPKLMRGEIEI
jgi:type I restriction enzyme S subunit